MPAILIIGAITAIFAAPPTIKHTLLISGTDLNYVGIVDTNGTIAWKYDEVQSAAGNGQKNDCWLLPNGNVVYSYQWGVRIVDVRTSKVIWDRPTPKRNNQSGETHSCQPLDGGSSRFLVPECFADTAFIVEVDTAKNERRRIALKNQGNGTHGKWRQIRKTAQNTYLVSSYDLHHSYEYDTLGRLVHDFPAGGYVACRLENGNTLTGTGDDCRFVEYNASGTLVWEVNNTTAAVTGLGIGFGSEAQRLQNGNTIITNWGGHGTGFGAAVVEIKPDRTVVGAIPASFPTSIASVKVIDGWKFPVRQFTITATAGANGTIAPSGAVLVDSATDKTFTITANAGYGIDSVKVDGVSVGVENTYMFTSVKINHLISVVFEKTVAAQQTVIERVISTEPIIVSVGEGTILCAIPFTGTTFIRVFNWDGKRIAEHMVGGPGNYTLPARFARGVYAISFKNSGRAIKWNRTVAVK